MFSVSYFAFFKQAFDKILRFHRDAIGRIVLLDQIQNFLRGLQFQMANQKNNVGHIGRLVRSAGDARGHAFHGEQIFRHGHGQTQVRKLREISRGRFVPGGNETFDTVIEPIHGKVLLGGNAMGEFANGLCGLKKRVHVFRRQAGG